MERRAINLDHQRGSRWQQQTIHCCLLMRRLPEAQIADKLAWRSVMGQDFGIVKIQKFG